jgi:hypothetical protein
VTDELTFERKLLREWLSLDKIREQIMDAAEHKNYSEVSLGVESYVSAASCVEWKTESWFDAAEKFEKAVTANVPTLQFALLRIKVKNMRGGRGTTGCTSSRPLTDGTRTGSPTWTLIQPSDFCRRF